MYFNSTSLRALLKNSMGCSKPSLFFSNKTTTIVSSNVKEKYRKSLSKSRLIKIGASFNAYLILLREFLASFNHLTSQSFFNIPTMNVTILAKWGIHLLKKRIFPKKD